MTEQKYQLAMQNLALATDMVFTLQVENAELKRLLEEYERTAKEQTENVSGGTPEPAED